MKPGDVVVRIGRRRRMTVVKLVGARALCRWFVEADLYLGWFNINSLTVQDNGENYYQ